MSLIDDIRKDREADTDGPWLTQSQLDRVPQMEAALLAADELVSAAMALCMKANKPMKAGRKWATYDVDVMTDAVSHYKSAHAAYRAATGAA